MRVNVAIGQREKNSLNLNIRPHKNLQSNRKEI